MDDTLGDILASESIEGFCNDLYEITGMILIGSEKPCSFSDELHSSLGSSLLADPFRSTPSPQAIELILILDKPHEGRETPLRVNSPQPPASIAQVIESNFSDHISNLKSDLQSTLNTEVALAASGSNHEIKFSFPPAGYETLDLTTELALKSPSALATPEQNEASKITFDVSTPNQESTTSLSRPSHAIRTSFAKAKAVVLDLTTDSYSDSDSDSDFHSPPELLTPPTTSETIEASKSAIKKSVLSSGPPSSSSGSSHAVRRSFPITENEGLDLTIDLPSNHLAPPTAHQKNGASASTVHESDWMEIDSTSSIEPGHTFQRSSPTTAIEVLDLTEDSLTLSAPLITLNKHVAGNRQFPKNKPPQSTQLIISIPPTTQGKEVIGSKIVKKKSLCRGRSLSPFSDVEFVENRVLKEKPLPRHRSVSPPSRVDGGTKRCTYVHVWSQVLQTGAKINEAVVEVLDDLTIIRIRKIGEKRWDYARKGADWDNRNEKLCLDFVKLMGWAIDSEEYGVFTLKPGKRFERLREVRDMIALQMEIRHSKDLAFRTGKLELGVFPLGHQH